MVRWGAPGAWPGSSRWVRSAAPGGSTWVASAAPKAFSTVPPGPPAGGPPPNTVGAPGSKRMPLGTVGSCPTGTGGASSAPTAMAASIWAGVECTPTPAATVRSAVASWTAVGRCAGFLRKQCSITVHSGSGRLRGRAGSCERCICRICSGPSPWNGGWPVSSSYIMMPAP